MVVEPFEGIVQCTSLLRESFIIHLFYTYVVGGQFISSVYGIIFLTEICTKEKKKNCSNRFSAFVFLKIEVFFTFRYALKLLFFMNWHERSQMFYSCYTEPFFSLFSICWHWISSWKWQLKFNTLENTKKELSFTHKHRNSRERPLFFFSFFFFE